MLFISLIGIINNQNTVIYKFWNLNVDLKKIKKFLKANWVHKLVRP